jgi:hypothetical protein
LDDDTRLSYTKLWRGILNQDAEMIKISSKELGVKEFELFTSMITLRNYDDVMKPDEKLTTKSRLGRPLDEKSYKEEVQ